MVCAGQVYIEMGCMHKPYASNRVFQVNCTKIEPGQVAKAAVRSALTFKLF